MKFVLTYTLRPGGSAEDRVESAESAQKLLANWQPAASATMIEWVQRLDGNGGFAVIEQDNAADLYRDLATWSPWLDFEVYPVMDILDATPIQEDAINTAKSVV